MKTTIEIDESKVLRIMEYTGIKTRREAIDYALTHAERLARIEKVLSKPFYTVNDGDIVDPNYDVMKLRAMERPAMVFNEGSEPYGK